MSVVYRWNDWQREVSLLATLFTTKSAQTVLELNPNLHCENGTKLHFGYDYGHE
jgi:hypothetical protein